MVAAILGTIGTVTGPILNSIGRGRARRDANQNARNPNSIRSEAEAKNNLIIGGIGLIMLVLIILIYFKNKK